MFELWLQQGAPAMAVQVAVVVGITIIVVGVAINSARRTARRLQHDETMAKMPLEHAEAELRLREQWQTEREKNAGSNKQIEGKARRD